MPPEEEKEIEKIPEISATSDVFVDANEEEVPRLSNDIEGLNTKEIVQPTPIESHKTNFQNALNHFILSASPFIKYPLPYLETQYGITCELRKYFPEVMYSSPNSVGVIGSSTGVMVDDAENNNYIEDVSDPVMLNSKISTDKPRILWEPPHSFTTLKLTSAIGSDEVQGSIADFRRKGSRLDLVPEGRSFLVSEEFNRSDASSWNTLEHDKMKPGLGGEQIDALDPLKHQRLSLLFCSYSPVSANSPYFCVNPWYVSLKQV